MVPTTLASQLITGKPPALLGGLAKFDNYGSREKAVLERQVEDLQKLIGEQAIEIRFLKRLSKS